MSKTIPIVQISQADIRAAYAQGEETVIAMIAALIEQQNKTTEHLVETINQLKAQIEHLENQRKKDSQNSSKPPSGEGFGKRTKSLRPKGNNSSGGQPGHPGSTLEWHETIDEIIEHPIDTCEH